MQVPSHSKRSGKPGQRGPGHRTVSWRHKPKVPTKTDAKERMKSKLDEIFEIVNPPEGTGDVEIEDELMEYGGSSSNEVNECILRKDRL